MASKNKNIKFNRRNALSRNAMRTILIAAAAIVVVAVVTVIAVHVRNSNGSKNENTNYTFTVPDEFSDISDIKSLNETVAVFTDAKTGKKGLMTLDGKITEKAEHNDFTVCCDQWRSYRYIADSPRSEYPLLVDIASGTVTTRQYHGLTSPERTPCWSEAGKHLAWTDGKGYAGEIKRNELPLANGLYPVASSLAENAKWGYIGEKLQLEIALLYDDARDFGSGLAAVRQGENWGYINENGVTAIPFDFQSVAELDAMSRDTAFIFTNGIAPVKKNGLYGIMNTSGETIVGFEFAAILPGKNGTFIAKSNGKWGLLTVDKKYIEQTTQPAAEQTTAGNMLAAGNYTVKTSGSVLNMRAEADKNSSVVGKIPNGTTVTVQSAVQGWAFINYSGIKGWVSTDFLIAEVKSSTTAATAVQNQTSTTKSV